MRTALINRRKELNIKQTYVAKKMNCTTRQVRRYEKGEVDVPFDLAIIWARLLKVSMNQFKNMYIK
jgi:transcriptional regulator with XRE-family HTH domain